MTDPQIERIAVVGAGLMGVGIAQEFALAGYQVTLHDRTDELLHEARENIRSNLLLLSSLGRLDVVRIEPALAAITTSTDLGTAVSRADLVIEAIFEDLPAKQALFHTLSSLCGSETIFASNTSSFMPSRLAEVVSRPERLLVAHYFNPPYLIPLVEIVPGPRTSNQTIATMVELLERIGKHPVVLRKEAIGFVGNRLQFALFREALAIVEQGVAGPEAIDRVVKFGFGRRLAVTGPFEVFDLAGLDTILAICAQIFPDLATSTVSAGEVSDLLRRRVEQGQLGVKSGQGFHEWTPEQIAELKTRLSRALAQAEASG
ncbi:MAG: 3-hydroxyacyl-CoA dehydrogenase family protein [Isosphaeraceae bacterium]